MAQVPNTKAFTLNDGLLDYLNLDTQNKVLAFSNAATAYGQTATAPDPGAGGTINTAGLSVARVSPAAARTGVILQAGSAPGQEVTIINEAAAATSITFAAAGTSNVADGVSDVLAGLNARTFVWDSVTALWYPMK
jgi:hypothetical protein